MGTPVTLRQARSCLIFAIADKRYPFAEDRGLACSEIEGAEAYL
jgi:hypothetical protein